MSRDTPTHAETVVGQALARHLITVGHEVTNIDYADRPDLRLSVDGALTGFEIVQIPPRRVMELLHARFKQLRGNGAKFVRVVWPQEPDFWVEQVIMEKQSKLAAYRRNLGGENVCLVIHTPIGLKEPPVRVANPGVMSLIRSAATHTKNSFDAIYFYDSVTGVEKLVPCNPPWPKTQVVIDGGYPTDGFVIGTASFTTTNEGDAPVLYDFGIIEPTVLVVPPLSPGFKMHKPKYKNPRLRVSVLAGATDTKISFEPLDEQ